MAFQRLFVDFSLTAYIFIARIWVKYQRSQCSGSLPFFILAQLIEACIREHGLDYPIFAQSIKGMQDEHSRENSVLSITTSVLSVSVLHTHVLGFFQIITWSQVKI